MTQPTNQRARAYAPARPGSKVQRPNSTAWVNPVRDDDVLAKSIERELRHDALTAALGIEVEVWDRVVHLRGVVPGPSEAEAAESVAERVDGVGLVADDLQLRRAEA